MGGSNAQPLGELGRKGRRNDPEDAVRAPPICHRNTKDFHYFIYLLAHCKRACAPWLVCAGQRATLEGRVFLSTVG